MHALIEYREPSQEIVLIRKHLHYYQCKNHYETFVIQNESVKSGKYYFSKIGEMVETLYSTVLLSNDQMRNPKFHKEKNIRNAQTSRKPVKNVHVFCSQWRIQDFPEGVRQPQGARQPII